jgi:hypothetical protein
MKRDNGAGSLTFYNVLKWKVARGKITQKHLTNDFTLRYPPQLLANPTEKI